MNHVLQILFVLGLISTGYYARRRGLITGAGTAEFARILVHLFYPALILATLPRLSAEDLVTHIRMPFLVMGIAFAGLSLGMIAVRLFHPMPNPTQRAFLFNCLVNNYLFLPLPLVWLAYGERGAALLFFSAAGYELVLWTVGMFLLAPGGTFSERIRRAFGLPLLCVLISLLWISARDLWGFSLPAGGWSGGLLARIGELFAVGFETIGRATVAVSMLVAGSRIAVLQIHRMRDLRIWTVAAIRLIGVPALVFLLVTPLQMEPVSRGVLMMVAVMPASISSIVFGEQFGGDMEFLAGTLLLTHLGALVTVPLFLWLAG